MSIGFTLKIAALLDYMDESRQVAEHTSYIITAEMELGSNRFFRTICTRTSDAIDACIEECGAVTMDITQCKMWLIDMARGVGSIPVLAALGYVTVVEKELTDAEYLKNIEEMGERVRTECTITWG